MLLILVSTICFVAGCAPTAAAEAAASREPPLASADVAMPPKELVDAVSRVVTEPPLSLGVEGRNKGTVVTGWKRYRGDWHIGRYWQERTRYRIEVAPDWDEPLARSRLTVTAETEQRAAEGQRWDREPRLPRAGRAAGTLSAILSQLRDTAAPP
jgi:hypothetical protein